MNLFIQASCDTLERDLVLIRSYVPRVVGIRTLVELRAGLDRLEGYYIDALRQDGATWTEIGEAFGISRQGAQQKYGPK